MINPIWESEEELLDSIHYMFLEGNFSCDCNKRLFLADAHQQDRSEIEEEEDKCGDTLTIKRLTVIRPDGSELDLPTSL